MERQDKAGVSVTVTSADVETSRELVAFIESSPSMFHTVATARRYLDAAGFVYLPEGGAWQVEPGGCYYTTRNGSSIIAWRVGPEVSVTGSDGYHFQMTAAHADSPTFKLKSVPVRKGPGDYLRLDVEAYGGPIDSTWFDRPLGLAGRVLVRDGARVESRLYASASDVCLIPNVAIHFNRQVNDGVALNRQVDLCPIFSTGALKQDDLDALLAASLGCEPGDILARDLFLVNRQGARVWGWRDEFVSSPKLDDLQCAFACLKAFLAASANPRAVSVCAIFDNEEVGSGTKQGALSTLLRDTLTRCNACLGGDEQDYLRAVARSFLVSCDNVHAVHPNHEEKTDDLNRCWLNRGVVVKEVANEKYTTDAFSHAVFRAICERAGVPLQHFANRSDSAGGSTLGNLSNTQVSVHALDIGLPQLAMHSSYETTGACDTALGIAALTAFFEADLRIEGADAFTY